MTDHGSRVTSGTTGEATLSHGGFAPDRTDVVRGRPEAGETIVSDHFLDEASYPVPAPNEVEGDT